MRQDSADDQISCLFPLMAPCKMSLMREKWPIAELDNKEAAWHLFSILFVFLQSTLYKDFTNTGLRLIKRLHSGTDFFKNVNKPHLFSLRLWSKFSNPGLRQNSTRNPNPTEKNRQIILLSFENILISQPKIHMCLLNKAGLIGFHKNKVQTPQFMFFEYIFI